MKCYAGMVIFIEGHSRGGAIGSIAAADIGSYWEDFGQVEMLTTFGAPRPGNFVLSNSIARACRTIRRYTVQTAPLWGMRDPVPHLPKGPKWYHPPGGEIKLFGAGRPSKLHSLDTYRKALSNQR